MIPVGLDAYRQWERWPYQRIGARAYLRSTYDRAGGNEGADASHFLYQEAGSPFVLTPASNQMSRKKGASGPAFSASTINRSRRSVSPAG